MGKKTITFGDIQIEKHKFHCHENLTFLEDIDNILESNKISSDEKNHKYFIAYLRDDYKVKSLHIMMPKTSAYFKSYDGHTKWMHFLIMMMIDWKQYNNTWDKVSTDFKKESYPEPV